MDNFLKSFYEILFVYFYLLILLFYRRFIFFVKKGGVIGGKNRSIEMYLLVIEMRYLVG